MGERSLQGLAAEVAGRVALDGPLHVFFVAREYGLSLFAAHGMPEPATLIGNSLYFDIDQDWRPTVQSIVCGHVLRTHGRPDLESFRSRLAYELGMGTPARSGGGLLSGDAFLLH